MPQYILISGKSNHGKDELGKLIKEELESRGKNVYILHYADHLKEIAKTFYGWDGNKDEKGRNLLQSLGDTNGKIKSKDNLYYVKHLINLTKYLLDKNEYVIIPDTRYLFEIDYVEKTLEQNEQMKTIRIERLNFKSPLTQEQQRHESEVGLDKYNGFDCVVINSTLEQLKESAKIICEKYYGY